MTKGKIRMTTPPTDPYWWMAWAVPVPFLGLWIRLHFAQNKRIADALEAAAEAHKEAANAHVNLANCRLNVEQEFAKNGYLSALEKRISVRLERMESDIKEILKGKNA